MGNIVVKYLYLFFSTKSWNNVFNCNVPQTGFLTGDKTWKFSTTPGFALAASILFNPIACIILSLSGCYNYKELNEYSIVTGIAIDKTNEGYKVSTLISNVPKSSSGTESNNSSDIVVYEGVGESIFSAFKDIGLISPKELYLNSFSILIISEEAAKDGINPILDFFIRYSSSRNNFDIVISKDCEAKDTLKILTSITNSPSQSISDNLKTTTELQGGIKKVTFDDLVSTIIKDGIDPTISTISIIGDKEIGFTKDNLESSEPSSYIKLGSIAAFKDDKLVDFATHEESVGINIITKKIKEIYFTFDYKDGFVVIDATSFKTDINTKINNNTPMINIDMKGEVRIMETMGNIDLEDDKTILEIQKKANDIFKSFVKKAINFSIKNKSDILGIGREFYINHPSFYNKDTFNIEKVKYNINSDIKINNKVSSKNSLESAYDR